MVKPVRILTFGEMNKIFDAFGAEESHLTFLVVVGPPGIGKSTVAMRLKNALLVDCNIKPFGLYSELYGRRDAGIIVLDDVEGLLSNPPGVALLKGLCQTRAVKTVSWISLAADNANLPRSFQTRARVLMLLNSLNCDARNKNFEALLSRAILYAFNPSILEIHQEVGRWRAAQTDDATVDDEVYAYIGERLESVPELCFRHYEIATQQIRDGLDWRNWLNVQWGRDPKFLAVEEILRMAAKGDPELQTANGRVAKFRELGHGTRSTYMEVQKRVMTELGMKRLPKAPSRLKPVVLSEVTLPVAAS